MIHAPAARTSTRQPAAPARTAVRPSHHAPAPGPVLRRCACGGGCPACRAKAAAPALPINAPGDVFEREAERAANAVMSASPPAAPAESSATTLRRCACGGSCPSCRKKEEEAQLRREQAGAGDAPGFAPPVVHHVLASPGRPLEARTRGWMEQRFGVDFGGVRVHDDARAAESARAVDAHAYTVGNNVVFGAGRYAPGTDDGNRLIAHELAHTLQQGRTARRLQRACGAAEIGAPTGCLVAPPQFLEGYPTYRSVAQCDDFQAGEEERLVADARALPPDAEVELHGYADARAPAAFSQGLSCARALRARRALLAAPPAGAGVVRERIVEVYGHGAPGAQAPAGAGVVVTPRRAAALPAQVAPAGADDFIIRHVPASDTEHIYFPRASSGLNPDAALAIALIQRATNTPVRLVGYASEDEPASVAQERADAVRRALEAPPAPVPVTSATANTGAGPGQSAYSRMRRVDVLPAAAAATTRDCKLRDKKGHLVHPPLMDCGKMDKETEGMFISALAVANDAMDRAAAAVTSTPGPGTLALIDRFFGDHEANTLATLRRNLDRLKARVALLPGVVKCGNECDRGGCSTGTTLGYNLGVDDQSRITLCVPGFKNAKPNDRARMLIHETAHGTSPLGGAPRAGTTDVAYRHERMLFQLPVKERLRNSDSYALFAMFLRETLTSGDPAAEPSEIGGTPSVDQLIGFGPDAPAMRLALARAEKRLAWAKDWMGQLHGAMHRVRVREAGWAKAGLDDVLREAAARFPVAPPAASSRPTLVDQTRVAAILDRYTRMHAIKRELLVLRAMEGGVTWAGSGPDALAGTVAGVGPEFFRASPDDQVDLLLEAVARATRGVEPEYIPAYVSLARWIHRTAEE